MPSATVLLTRFERGEVVESKDPEFEYLPISSLRFDPENPRFPTTIDGSDRAAVLSFMLLDAGLIDLMRSIAKQGFFPGEPLLVSPNPHEDGTWIVVEGNRRLAASSLIAAPGLAPTNHKVVAEVAALGASQQLTSLPCLRFEERAHILAHLGYRHVTGIKEWEPLAKARFLRQQYDSESGTKEERLKNVARSIGSRADYVGRLLTAFEIYSLVEEKSYFDIEGLTETSIDFSLLSSVLAYSDIVEYLGLASSRDFELKDVDISRLEFLTRFVFERAGRATRLGESRNIRPFADVLANADAREALEKGLSLSQAHRMLGGSGGVFRGLVAGARENLTLAREETEGVRFGVEDIATIEEVRGAAIALRNLVQERLDS